MSIIVWEVSRWRASPERKEYVRETARFYVRKDGRRDSKETSYSKLYSNYDEACAAIKARMDSEKARKKLELIRKAAPDLLEALEAALTVLTDSVGDFDHEAATAAIAKARGES
jgi:hypothetical protein